MDHIILLKNQNLPRDNLTDHNKELLLHQVSKCTKLIIEAKDEHLA